MKRVNVDGNAKTVDERYYIIDIIGRGIVSGHDLDAFEDGESVVMTSEPGGGFRVNARAYFGFVELLGENCWYIVPDWKTIVRSDGS